MRQRRAHGQLYQPLTANRIALLEIGIVVGGRILLILCYEFEARLNLGQIVFEDSLWVLGELPVQVGQPTPIVPALIFGMMPGIKVEGVS